MASLFDYFPAQTLFITFADIQQKAEQFHQDTQNRYESHRVDPMRPLLPPSDLWFAIDEVNRWLKGYPRLTITSEKIRKSAAKMNANVANLPDIAIQSSAKEPFSAFQQFRQKFDGNILFSVESEGRRETLLDLLAPLGVKPKQVNSLDEAQGLPFSLIISPLDQGFVVETGGHGTRPYDDELNTNGENDNNYVGAGPVPARNLAIICETDLLGERVQTRREKNRKAVNPDTLIRNLAELKIGQAVVHLENGVGVTVA